MLDQKKKLRLARLLNKVDPDKGLSDYAVRQFEKVFEEIPRHFSTSIVPYDERIKYAQTVVEELSDTLTGQIQRVDKDATNLSHRFAKDLTTLETKLSQLVGTSVSVVAGDLAKHLNKFDVKEAELAKALKKFEKDIEELFWIRTLNGSNNVQAVLNIKSNGAQSATNVTGINFGVNLSVVVNADGTVTVNASGGGGGGLTVLQPTETPDGSRTVFTFATATAQPSFLLVDGAWQRATSKAGTVNWTWNAGTTQATLTVPPQDDVVGIV